MAALPNLLIIGAQKCGTTSLDGYLAQHPEVSMARPKELDFFIAREEHDDYVVDGNWDRGVEWYSSHFPDDARVRGEASPNYTIFPHARGIPERAARVVPDAKLVYMVRDPIDRVVAHYLHRRAAGRETRSLDATLGDLDRYPISGFVSRSRYFTQLERWLEHYPRASLLVVAQEDLRDRRVETLREIFDFLGVDESFATATPERRDQRSSEKRAPTPVGGRLEAPLRRAGQVLPARVRGSLGAVARRALGRRLERPALSPERRRELEDLLRDDVVRLRELTGRPFASWSI